MTVTKSDVYKALAKLDDINTKDLDPEIEFNQQGMDSLDIIQALFEVQDFFDIEISEEAIANNEWGSVNKIVSRLNSIKNNSN